MHPDRQRPMIIGHLSDSGKLKIQCYGSLYLFTFMTHMLTHKLSCIWKFITKSNLNNKKFAILYLIGRCLSILSLVHVWYSIYYNRYIHLTFSVINIIRIYFSYDCRQCPSSPPSWLGHTQISRYFLLALIQLLRILCKINLWHM